MTDKTIGNAFLQSALADQAAFMSLPQFLQWMEEKKQATCHRITPIAFADMKQWHFHPQTGNLEHQTGKFFSIEGVHIRTNWDTVKEWSQPIINQPEIGFLGIIAKSFGGVLHFLMQAKIEPGNINGVQLSPTLQATRSNYTQVHQGNAPHYLEYFMGRVPGVKVLLDQLQSEQGARFFRKRNRNIIVEVAGDIPVLEDFCWLTLAQIKQLLSFDNVVNMDTRTVISGITFRNGNGLVVPGNSGRPEVFGLSMLASELDEEHALHTIEEVISWITRHKSLAELEVERVPLSRVQHWVRDSHAIYHEDHKYFSVIAVQVEIGNREVRNWTQPLVQSAQEGIMGFIVKNINGVYHFLVQAKMEAGNLDIIELAPTVQCLTGNYRKGLNEYEVPFLDYFLHPEQHQTQVLLSTMQSEEGGRFYREQNRNMIVEVGEAFSPEVPEKYIWMTLHQIKTFIRFNNYLNIQARSLLSAIRFVS